MPLTPNIDEKGRRARIAAGVFLLVLAAGLVPVPGPWTPGRVFVFALTFGLGLFVLFEARQRWCALRACGIKTKL